MAAEPSPHLRNLLRSDEELAWTAKPEKTPFLLTRSIAAVVMGGFFGIFFGVFALFGSALVRRPLVGVAVTILLILGFIAVPLLGALLAYRHAEYAVTNDRLLQFSGVIGRDFSSIAWDNVQDFEVTVGAIDTLFDTGTITVIASGHGGITFRFVPDPYATTERLTEAKQRRRPPAEQPVAP